VSALQATLVDTDAFSLLFVRRGSSDPRIAGWRELLTGRQVLISFQTRAELLAGATADGWGDRRTTELRMILDRTPTIGVDDEVIDATLRSTPNADVWATHFTTRPTPVTDGSLPARSQKPSRYWRATASTCVHRTSTS